MVQKFSNDKYPELFEKLYNRGFGEMTLQDLKFDLGEKGTIYKDIFRNPFSGMEQLYWMRRNGRSVIVCTGYRSAPKREKEADDYFGWVLLKDDRNPKVKLFSFENRKRSVNFFETLYEYADAFADILEHWPDPPVESKKEYILKRPRGVMHRMWFVSEGTPEFPKGRKIYLTDIGISEKSRNFIEAMFVRYEKQAAKNGGKPRRVIRAEKQIPVPLTENK